MSLRRLSILVLLLLQVEGNPSSGCNCGVRQEPSRSFITTKITGGEDASPNEFPWIAFLKIRVGGSVVRCGATLINDRYNRVGARRM